MWKVTVADFAPKTKLTIKASSWVGHLIPIFAQIFDEISHRGVCWSFELIDTSLVTKFTCLELNQGTMLAFIHAKKKSSWWAQRRQKEKPNIFWKSIFHVSMHLFRYRSQITQIRQIRQIRQITDHTDHIFGKTKLWCLLWSITELTHPNMEFLCFT